MSCQYEIGPVFCIANISEPQQKWLHVSGVPFRGQQVFLGVGDGLETCKAEQSCHSYLKLEVGYVVMQRILHRP